jgi:hypothetical protein
LRCKSRRFPHRQRHILPTQSMRRFSAGGPVLNRKQRAWIRRVLHSRAYGSLRSRLRFAGIAGYATPLVIFVDHASPGEIDNGGHVIGEGCNVWFDPYLHGLIVGTGVLCSPPTPKPVY